MIKYIYNIISIDGASRLCQVLFMTTKFNDILMKSKWFINAHVKAGTDFQFAWIFTQLHMQKVFECTMNDFSALILAINYSISVIMNYINVFLA